MVKGIKHARKRSAQARLTKYLLFVNRIGPREPNITNKAAKFPINDKRNIIEDKILINNSPSMCRNIDEEEETIDLDGLDEIKNDKFRDE